MACPPWQPEPTPALLSLVALGTLLLAAPAWSSVGSDGPDPEKALSADTPRSWIRTRLMRIGPGSPKHSGDPGPSLKSAALTPLTAAC